MSSLGFLLPVAVALLVMFSIGGIAYALLYPKIAGEAQKEKRMSQISGGRDPAAIANRDASRDKARRRKSIEETLKEAGEKQKAKSQAGRLTLKVKLKQAGLAIDSLYFWILSGVLGVVVFLILVLFKQAVLISLGIGLAAGFGVPQWVVSYLRKRRLNQFTENFPNAIDIIVRGVKAGLPLGECITLISKEAPEPVRSEFKVIVEAQSVGASVSEAIQNLPKRIPVPEASFFAISISIQQQAGGNLAETLSNLSGVLRSRKTLRQKVQAMSMEAKSSGAIIGAMPILVSFFVYLTSPDYINILFVTETGNFILVGAICWMGLGIGIMKKMINFKI